jgi:hypothetical protein
VIVKSSTLLTSWKSYFRLTNLPAKMKLQIAMKATTDEYTQQWVITIYKELRKYDNVKQAINLWIKKKIRLSSDRKKSNK